MADLIVAGLLIVAGFVVPPVLHRRTSRRHADCDLDL